MTTKSPFVEVNINDIEQDLLAYLRRVEQGETLVIMKTGRPLAEIRPITTGSERQRRPFALCAEEFQTPADFDDWSQGKSFK